MLIPDLMIPIYVVLGNGHDQYHTCKKKKVLQSFVKSPHNTKHKRRPSRGHVTNNADFLVEAGCYILCRSEPSFTAPGKRNAVVIIKSNGKADL